jgi:CBS domain-containing protein
MDELLAYEAADAMSYHPVTVGLETTLAEVNALLGKHRVASLPVCEEGALKGIVTRFDVMKAFVFEPGTLPPPYEEIMRRPAASVMTTHVVTVHPHTTLTQVLRLMAETRHNTLPVVIGALLIGMIARQDVLRAVERAARGMPAGQREPTMHLDSAGAG